MLIHGSCFVLWVLRSSMWGGLSRARNVNCAVVESSSMVPRLACLKSWSVCDICEYDKGYPAVEWGAYASIVSWSCSMSNSLALLGSIFYFLLMRRALRSIGWRVLGLIVIIFWSFFGWYDTPLPPFSRLFLHIFISICLRHYLNQEDNI